MRDCSTDSTHLRKLQRQPVSTNRRAAALLLLVLSGDIARTLGHVVATEDMFSCTISHHRLSWSKRAVSCGNCDVWHHNACASMHSLEYDGLENVACRCYCCKSVNADSFIYRYIIHQYKYHYLNHWQGYLGMTLFF